jgi:predicted metal-dependent HD superfamily phosphohydrolase
MDQNSLAEVKRTVLTLLDEQLDRRFVYHDKRHVLDVFDRALHYADLEGLNGRRRALLAVAALFHDAGCIFGLDDHERGSVRLCRAHLPRFGFGEDEIKRVERMVLATRLPQRPHSRLAALLCDADLDYLGRPDYFTISCRLRREMENFGSAMDDRQWLRFQVQFLSEHRYFTPVARELRDAGKQNNLAQIERQLDSRRSR